MIGIFLHRPNNRRCRSSRLLRRCRIPIPLFRAVQHRNIKTPRSSRLLRLRPPHNSRIMCSLLVPPQQTYVPYQPPVYVTPPVYSQTPAKPGNGMAVASLVLGILSITFCCAWYISAVMAIVGLILGIVAKRKGSAGMATAGIILNVFGLLLAIVMIVFVVILVNDPEWMNEFLDEFYYYNEYYGDYHSYGEGGQRLAAFLRSFLTR